MPVPDQRPHTVQGILNKSFDKENEVLVFELIERSPDGTPRYASASSVTYAFDNNADGNPIYIGKAAMGTAKSTAEWQIRKLTYSGESVTDIQWAGGSDSFENVWNDRASYTYS